MNWPRTLFGRNLLLIVVLLLVCEVAWLGIFRLFVQKPRLERIAGYVGAYIAALDAGLQRLPADRKADYIAAINGTGAPRLLRARAAAARFDALMPLRARILLAPMAEALGPDVALRTDRGPPRMLWIRARLDGEAWWIGFPAEGLWADAGSLLLAGTLLSVVLAGAGAVLIQRRIHRPLMALARAADAVGRGESPPPQARGAPSEIARVMTSFERMQASLAQADAERTLLLAGVSHDLRTPLTKLRLCVEMLRGQVDEELVDSMTRSIVNADGIIGQFVDYARIGSDEAQRPCDLGELLAAVVADAAPAAIALHVAPLPPLAVRPLALRRALANLVENALRHGGGTIEVRAEPLGEQFAITVLDRGAGIPAAMLATVREPFVRMDASRGSPGAGLGLAIAERVARLHGGALELANRPGGGLQARILLPAAVAVV